MPSRPTPMSETTTRAPRSAISSACARPMPRPAPVTRATWPSSVVVRTCVPSVSSVKALQSAVPEIARELGGLGRQTCEHIASHQFPGLGARQFIPDDNALRRFRAAQPSPDELANLFGVDRLFWSHDNHGFQSLSPLCV